MRRQLSLALLPLPLLLSRALPPLKSESGALRVPPSIAARLKAGQRLPASNLLRSVLRWLVWVGIVVAVADPRMALTARALPASGRDIVLALDFSGSMLDQDLMLDGKPARREDVMKHVAKEFIRRRSGDRIGLVVFASDAYVAAPLSFDLAAVSRALDDVNVELMGMSKTAIGDGLGLALKRLRNSPAPSRLIILLSDGGNNAGSAEPIPVARLAKSFGVRIDTIALGPGGSTAEGDGDAVDAALSRRLRTSAEDSVPGAVGRGTGKNQPLDRPARKRHVDNIFQHDLRAIVDLPRNSCVFRGNCIAYR